MGATAIILAGFGDAKPRFVSKGRCREESAVEVRPQCSEAGGGLLHGKILVNLSSRCGQAENWLKARSTEINLPGEIRDHLKRRKNQLIEFHANVYQVDAAEPLKSQHCIGRKNRL
jgi:hypothetical protein